jgi:multidrug resistance efflux pump
MSPFEAELRAAIARLTQQSNRIAVLEAKVKQLEQALRDARGGS